MNPEQAETLLETFCEVVRTLAFMFGERAEPDEMPEVDEPCLQATMTFSGPLAGRCTMLAPETTVDSIVLSMRGEPAPDDELDEARADALRELLNVVCGNMLTALGGRTEIFHLGVPETSALDPQAWAEALAEETSLPLLVDEEPLLLQVVFEEI